MLRKIMLLGGALALVATIALAAMLGIGNAASTNSCTNDTNGQPNCFSVTVDPMFVTSGQTGLINAKFRNVFGSATATHTAIRLDLPAGLSGISITTVGRATCSTPLQTGVAQSLTCSFGNVPSGTTVQMRVQFTNSVTGTSIDVPGTLTFAEGNGGTNDSFMTTGSASSVSGTDKAGYCTTVAQKFEKRKQVPLVTASDSSSGQTATIESLKALATGVPCTPIAAGVDSTMSGGPHPTKVSIIAFPDAAGTVTLLFPGVDASTFELYELIPGNTDWVKVLNCSSAPSSADFAVGTDSCIVSQTNVTIKGTKYVQDVLYVEGVPFDGHYGG